MPLSSTAVTDLAVKELLPALKKDRDLLDLVDRWARWDHDNPSSPRSRSTKEFKSLADVAQVPWGDLIVGSIAQTLYVEGFRRPDSPEDGNGWRIWQANGMDGRQVAIHRAVLTYGLAYGLALPGTTLGGAAMPSLRGVSPRQMIALYEDPAVDEWPVYALRTSLVRGGIRIEVYDETTQYTARVKSLDAATAANLEWTPAEHGAGVCPVVRYTNRQDLEGRTAGEVEPFIPLLGSIDQTKFDRLVVQRFASWIVRTVAGMKQSETVAATGETPEQVKLRLTAADLLMADDHDTKFGHLPASPLDGFIASRDSELRDLAAVSQTPAFELLGQMANLSAEALDAAKDSQNAKSDERKHTLGEQHEQLIRLGCHLAGDAAGAADFDAQVRWADTSLRSLAQAADAFGKLAQMLGVPPEILWPKIPGFTQQDVDAAKAAVEGARNQIDELAGELVAGLVPPAAAAPMDAAAVKAAADAMGSMIRSGAAAESAAAAVGLNLEFTGAVPTTLRLPEEDAAELEGTVDPPAPPTAP